MKYPQRGASKQPEQCLRKYRDRYGIWRTCHRRKGHRGKCKA